MPISDEIIELAPVKKTKTAFIIMIVAIGVLFAAAAAFLVLYLLKPSITEQPVIVRGVEIKREVSENSLFSVTENGTEVLYASIGHEYVVYANITVEQGASPNISWEWPRDDIELVESTIGEGAYIKFIPRAGVEHGKEVTIKARSQSDVNKSDSITFRIVNQGAEDFKITEHGFSGRTTKISNDTLASVLSITVPYYTSMQINPAYTVRYVQYGKYDPSTNTYNKITEINTGDGFANMVRVTAYKHGTKEKSDDVVEIKNRIGSFDIIAKKAGSCDIVMEANVNNGSEILTKTIEVTVSSNVTLEIPDTMYFFNKPVLTEEFLKDIADTANSLAISKSKLDAKVNSDPSLSYSTPSTGGAVLVLPYVSSSPTKYYEDILKHIVINPLNIQFNDQANGGAGALLDAWKKNIQISSSNSRILRVTDGKLETLAFCGTAVSADTCNITITDYTPGGAGSSITIPVRIIASNGETTLSLTHNSQTLTEEDGAITLETAPSSTPFFAKLVYKLTGPALEKAEDIANYLYVNNGFKLDYSASEMEVKIKGGKDVLTPNKDYTFDTFTVTKEQGGNSRVTNYLLTVEFEIKLKEVTNGQDPTLEIIKTGSQLPGYGNVDASWIKTITFDIKMVASYARFVASNEGNNYAGLNAVTKRGVAGATEQAGDYVLGDTEKRTSVDIYVQNASGGTLEWSTAEGLKQIIESDADYVLTQQMINTDSTDPCLTRSVSGDRSLVFAGKTPVSTGAIATIRANIEDIDGGDLGQLVVRIHVIDAITGFATIATPDTVTYVKGAIKANTESRLFISSNAVDMKVTKQFGGTSDYSSTERNIKLYYGGEKVSDKELIGTPSGNNTAYRLPDDDTVLYYFNKNSNVIYPGCDIYAVSLQKNKDLSTICIEFLLMGTDEYVGKHYGESFRNTAFMVATFTRIADGVEIFTNTAFDYNDKASMVRRDSAEGFNGALHFTINQNKSAALHVSALVDVSDVISDHVDPVVARSSEGIALCEDAYITVPSGFTFTGTEAGSGYSDISFTAPVSAGNEPEHISGFKVYYNTKVTPENFVLTVENAARSIVGIELLRGGSALPAELLFGQFIGSDKLSYEITVKITYETADPDRHTSFEGALLNLPSFLILSTSDVSHIVKVEGESSNQYRFSPDDADAPKGSVTSYEFTFTLTLSAGVGAKESGTERISVEREASASGESVNKSAGVVVATGLDRIEVYENGGQVATADAESRGTIEKTLRLSDPTDLKTLEFNLNFISLANADYEIEYKYTRTDRLTVATPDLSQMAGGSPLLGFTVGDTIRNATQSKLTISLTSDISVHVEYITFTFVFTDITGGAERDNVFYIDVKIKVEFEVFNISFDQDAYAVEAKYTVVTSEANEGEYTLYGGGEGTAIGFVFNNGDSKYTPNVATEKFRVYIGSKSGDSYSEYIGGDYELRNASASGKYLLAVKNTVKKDNQYYIVAEYTTAAGGKIVRARQITVTTTDSSLEFASSGNDIDPQNGKASVNLDNTPTGTTFKLAAVLKNAADASVEGKTVSYNVYSDPDCGTVSSDAVISAEGVITFTPTTASGKVYYKADCTDPSVTGVRPLIVEISFAVKATSVKLNAIANVLEGDTVTLYYHDGDNYVYVDIKNYISVASGFMHSGSTIQIADATLSVTTASSDKLKIVDGYTLVPLAVDTTSDTVSFTISATYGEATVSETYYVVINGFAAVTISANPAQPKLDILTTGDSFTVTHEGEQSIAGLTSAFALTETTGKASITGNTTVAVGTLAIGNGYKLVGTVTYTAAGGSAYQVKGGSIAITSAELSFDVWCNYTAAFALKYNGAALDKYNSVSGEGKHLIKFDENGNISGTYTLEVTSPDYEDSDKSYSFEINGNDIVTATVTTGRGPITLNVNKGASGEFSITLTVVLYKQTFDVTNTYYFAYGSDPETSLKYKTGAGTDTEVGGDSVYIDYDEAGEMTVITYTVGNVDVKSVVNITVIGAAVNGQTAGLTGSQSYSVTVNATKDGTIYFGGTVKTGSYTVHLPAQSVTLASHAPEFELSVTSKNLLPLGEATLSMSQKTSEFKGTVSYKYYVVNGKDYVQGYNEQSGLTDGLLKIVSSVLTAQTLRVKAVATVSTGVYADTTHEFYEDINITPVALPTLEWQSAPTTAAVGAEVNLADTYAVIGGNKGDLDLTITASTPDSSKTITVADDKFTVPDDMLAGGKITLTLGGSVLNDSTKINHGLSLVPVTHEIIVTPSSKVAGTVTIRSNAHGSVDLNDSRYLSYFAPYTGTGANQIHGGDSGDTFRISALRLADDEDNTTQFGVFGSRLLIKENIERNTQCKVVATITMNNGAYAGTSIEISATLDIQGLPTQSTNAVWNNGAYNTIAMTSQSDITGEKISVEVMPVSGISIANNGGAATITVDSTYNLYYKTENPGDKDIVVEYYVTDDNGDVYYRKLTVKVPAQEVTLTVKVDGSPSDTSAGNTIGENHVVRRDIGNQFLLNVFANITDATIAGVDIDATESGINVVLGQRTVLFSLTKSTISDITVTVNLKIVGITEENNPESVVPFVFKVSVTQPESDSTYNVDPTTFYIQKGSSQSYVSTWSASSGYRNGSSLTFSSVSNLKNLQVKINGNNYDPVSGTRYTISSNRSIVVENMLISFELQNPDTVGQFTFTVTYVVYSSRNSMQSQTITQAYTVNVIDTVAVTLDPNAGSDSVQGLEERVVNIQFTGEGTTYTGLPEITRTGYTFDGWFSTPVAGTTADSKIKNGETALAYYTAHTLYARWTVKTYNVEYNLGAKPADSVTGPSGTKSVTFGQPYGSLGKVEGVPKGYEFVGWYDGEKLITPQTIVEEPTGKTTIILTAHWAKKIYTISFVVGDNADAISEMKLEFGSALVLPTPRLHDGYEFKGWFTDNEHQSAVPTTLTEDMVSSDSNVVRLYAWIEQLTYTVTFDPNGGAWTSSAPAALSLKLGDTYGTLPTATEVAMPGYKLVGWTAADGTLVNGEMPYALAHGTKLSAKWQSDIYTIRFIVGEGGTAIEYTIRAIVGDTLVLPTPSVNDGYIFRGWYLENTDYTNSVSTGDKLNATMTDKALENVITLYAKIEKFTYTITFDANGGEWQGAYASQDPTLTLKVGDNYGTLPTDTNIKRAGYSFTGWQTAGGVGVTGTTPYAYAHGTVLVAQWSPIEYTIQFSGSNMTAPSQLQKHIGAELNLTTPEVTEGYKFLGWFLEEGHETPAPALLNADMIAKASDGNAITLYAKVEKITYTITFYLNGGEWASEYQAPALTVQVGVAYGSNLPAKANVTKTGHDFAGWKTAGGVSVSSTTPYAFAHGTVLIAEWTVNVYTIKFDTANIVGTVAQKTVKYGDTLVLPTPNVEEGSRFVEWCLVSAEGTAVPATLDETVVAQANGNKEITLYAKVELITYTITFNIGEGEWQGEYAETAPTLTLKVGDSYGTLPDGSQLTREGFTFAGWKTEGGIDITGGEQQYAFAHGTVLVAQWNPAD